MSGMSALIGALRVTLGMDTAAFEKGATDAERHMARLRKDMDRSARELGRIGRSMSLAITAPLGLAGTAMVSTAGQFEAAMNRIRATLGTSDAEFAALEAAARDLGKSTKFSATEAADAIEMLAKNGLTTAQILDGALASALTLAAAGGTDLATASDMATDVMGQFGFAAGDMAAVVDAMTGTMLASKFGVDDYGLALAQAGGVAGGLGVAFDDFNAALAATSSLFASGSDAGTALKTFLQRMVPQSAAAAAAMDDLGLAFFDADGNVRSMSEIAQTLRDGLAGLSEEARNEALTTIFGTDAMRTAIGLMQAGGAEIDRLSDKIASVSAEQQAAARMEGFEGAVARMRSAMQELGLVIADSGVLDAVTALVEQFTDFAAWLGELDPKIVQFGVVAAGLAAATGPVAIAIGSVVSAGAALLPVIAALTGPVWLGVGAIGAMAAGFSVLASRSLSAETALDRTNAAADRFERAMRGVEDADRQIAAAKAEMAAASARYRAAVAGESDQAAATAVIEVQAINERIGALERLRTARLAAARVAALEANAALEAAKSQIRMEVADGLGISYPRGRAGIGDYDARLAEFKEALDVAVDDRMADVLRRVANGGSLSEDELAAAKVVAVAELTKARVDALNVSISEFDAGPVQDLADTAGEAADRTQELNHQVGDVLDGLERTGDRVLDLRSGIAALRDAIGDGTLSGAAADAAREAIAGMETELARLEGIGRDAGEGVSGGVAKGIAAGADRPVAALQTLGQRLAGIAGQMGTGVVSAITQGLMSGDFSAAAGGLVSTLQAGLGSALGSVFSGVFTSAGGLASSIGSLGTSISALTQGLQFAGSAAAVGNLGAALGGLGSAVSAGLPAIGAVMAGFNLVSGLAGGFSSKSLKDQGVYLGVSGGDLAGDGYDTVRRSSYWGAKRSTRTSRNDLDAGLAAALSANVAALQEAVVSAYRAAGVSVAEGAVGAFQYAEQKISFRDKTEAEIEALLADWLAGYGDALSAAIGGLDLEAVRTLASVRSSLAPIGTALSGTLAQMAAVAEGIAGAAGGTDALAALAAGYYQGFFTEAERTEQLGNDLAAAFAALGLAMPETAAEFRALVEAQDLFTDHGRATYVSLLSLSDAFAALAGTADDAVAAAEAAEAAQLAAAEAARVAAEDQAAAAAEAAAAAAEAAAALAQSQAAVQAALAELGVSVSALAAGGLADAVGDADAAVSLIGGYLQDFYTEAERTALMTDRLRAAFADLGLALPRTSAGFRDMVEAQDLTTGAGQQTYAALMGLSEAVAQVFGTADSVLGSLRIDDDYFVTEFDARMAALAAQNGYAVVQQLDGGTGYRSYGEASLRLDHDSNSVLRRLLNVVEDWERSGMPVTRAF